MRLPRSGCPGAGGPAVPEERLMKVVFVEEVLGTAVPGEVKDVKGGFARNYLIPRGLAVPATKDALMRAESLAKKEEKRQAVLDAEARRLVARMEGHKVTLRARVGEQGRLYGSITAADIATKLEEILGEEVDRRRILLQNPIREAGSRMVTLRLTRNVSHQVEVEVEEEDTGRRRSTQSTASPPIPAPSPVARVEEVEDDDEDEDDDRDTDDSDVTDEDR